MKNDRVKFKIEFKKRLYVFVLRLISFLETLPKDSITQVIAKQLVRSGTSIVGNYIEAQSASSKKEFKNYFYYSLKSANESKLWICLIRDTNRTSDKKELTWLLSELSEISNIFASSILTLKGRKSF